MLLGILTIIALLLWQSFWTYTNKKQQTALIETIDEKISSLLQQQALLLTWQEKNHQNIQEQLQTQAHHARQELSQNFSQLQQTIHGQMTSVSSWQNSQIENFAKALESFKENTGQQLGQMRQEIQQHAVQNREEQGQTLQRFEQTLRQSLASLTESNAQRMQALQTDNAMRLEKMREVVDEKLQASLERRLGESFKIVSERLEKVHHSLGEMQQLAIGVGDLKRVLTNVKTRGTWGEVQLGMLLEQMLSPEQYSKNIATIPQSMERVEFAVKLPGGRDDLAPVWLPIDAKFPKEQYERLLDATDRADVEKISLASKELDRALRLAAKTIAEKYLAPPHTTDFGILFLPTEGLYAEVARRPGLIDEIQRAHRVSIAGPTTLSALLNSLQMGFRTLALEKRSAEVWQVLGAVKTEFEKFGEVLSMTKAALERVTKNIDKAEVRTRVMARKLHAVEALPIEVTEKVLALGEAHAC